MKRRRGEKKEKRIKLFISLFIVVIMVLSVLGFMMTGSFDNSQTYNGFKFNNINGRWITKIDKQSIAFDLYPYNVENINISKDIIESIKSSVQIDITSDFNSSFKEAIALTEFQLANVLAQNNQFLRVGFNAENEFNATIITCESSSSFIPVLYFKKSNVTKVYKEGNCIILDAKSKYDIVAIKDRILYGIFGVIE